MDRKIFSKINRQREALYDECRLPTPSAEAGGQTGATGTLFREASASTAF